MPPSYQQRHRSNSESEATRRPLENLNNLYPELRRRDYEPSSTRAVSAIWKKWRRDPVTYCIRIVIFLYVAYHLLHFYNTETTPAIINPNIDYRKLGEEIWETVVKSDVNAGEMPRERPVNVNWTVTEAFDFQNIW